LSFSCGLMHIDSEHMSSMMAARVYNFLIWTFKFYLSS